MLNEIVKAGGFGSGQSPNSSTQVVLAGIENVSACIISPVIIFFAKENPAVRSANRADAMFLGVAEVLDTTAMVCRSL